jgi:hypothetical protein
MEVEIGCVSLVPDEPSSRLRISSMDNLDAFNVQSSAKNIVIGVVVDWNGILKSPDPAPSTNMMFRMMQSVGALLLLLSLLCDALASSGGSLSSPSLHEIRQPVQWQRKHRRRLSCLHVSGGGSVHGRQSLAGNSAAPSSSLNLVQRYSRLIDTKPLMTKAITAGSIAALADVATQVFVLPPTIAGGVSWRRVAAFLLAGALFVGPYLHLWYSKLDAIVSPLSRHSVRTISKMLLDQSIGVSIFFPMYFTAYELASSLMHARCKCAKRAIMECWPRTFDFLSTNHCPVADLFVNCSASLDERDKQVPTGYVVHCAHELAHLATGQCPQLWLGSHPTPSACQSNSILLLVHLHFDSHRIDGDNGATSRVWLWAVRLAMVQPHAALLVPYSARATFDFYRQSQCGG